MSWPEGFSQLANKFAVRNICFLDHPLLMSTDVPSIGCAEGVAFGPVPSRRLGSSVGVNTVPCKTCTYSCVYCQLGRTTLLTVNRGIFRETRLVASAVIERVRSSARRPDFVTFLGCGEPTLASNLGMILREIASAIRCRTALLTNGSLMWDPKVRDEAMAFDVVMPTVSAGTEKLFRRIHRPHPSLDLQRVLSGIRKFSEEFKGELWVEVMLVRGLNDDEASLHAIGKAIEPLRASRVHITAPTRPPAEAWVTCPTRDAVQRALRIIPRAIDTTAQESGRFSVRGTRPIDDLLAIATMHPMREEQVLETLTGAGMSVEEAARTVKLLLSDSSIVRIVRGGKVFYRTNR